jgi:hypothetical protein
MSAASSQSNGAPLVKTKTPGIYTKGNRYVRCISRPAWGLFLVVARHEATSYGGSSIRLRWERRRYGRLSVGKTHDATAPEEPGGDPNAMR